MLIVASREEASVTDQCTLKSKNLSYAEGSINHSEYVAVVGAELYSVGGWLIIHELHIHYAVASDQVDWVGSGQTKEDDEDDVYGPRPTGGDVPTLLDRVSAWTVGMSGTLEQWSLARGFLLSLDCRSLGKGFL